MARNLWELSCHHGAELSVWGLRGLTQQIAYQITLSKLIVLFGIWWSNKLHNLSTLFVFNYVMLHPNSSREPSSCMIVGYNKSYHSIKQYRILHENSHKSVATPIEANRPKCYSHGLHICYMLSINFTDLHVYLLKSEFLQFWINSKGKFTGSFRLNQCTVPFLLRSLVPSLFCIHY